MQLYKQTPAPQDEKPSTTGVRRTSNKSAASSPFGPSNPSGSTSTAARENHTTTLTPVFRRSDYFVLGGAYLIVFLLLLVLVCIATGPWILP